MLSRTLYFYRAGFVALVLVGLLGFQRAVAMPLAVSEPSEWKSPLPAGEWVISQGPKDTIDCRGNWSSHCSNGPWNMCAIDIVKVLGQDAPNKNHPILSPADGTIVKAGFDTSGGGNFIQIEHGAGGRISLFLHLNSPLYDASKLNKYKQDHGGALSTVRQGDIIGYMGWGGSAQTGGHHLHFNVLADRGGSKCVSMVGIDGNTNLARGQKINSTNQQQGVPAPPLPSNPVAPQPPVAPPITAPPGSPDPWDVSWLPSDPRTIAAINPIIADPNAGGSPNAGLAGYGEMILNYSLASISGNPAGVNPAFALAMFRKEANFATFGAAPANNNPGNIICAGGKPLYGAKSCNGRFGVYANMEDGIKAYFWLLQYEYKPGGGSSYNCPDIPCIIRRYAPSSENNTNLYISQVTDWTRDFQNRISSGAPPSPAGPQKPSLSNPGNGSNMSQSADVTLSWNSAQNATQYKVELWGGPYSLMTSCNWQSGTSCHIGQMQPGTMSWHVKARNASGQESDWSDTWSFTVQQAPSPITLTPTPPSTIPPPPSANRPTLSSPGNGSSMPQSTDVTLSWNTSQNTTQYKVELWGGLYSLMTPCNWQSVTSCRIGQMWPGTMSWHAKARSANGQESDWSDTWSFTIQQTPTITPTFTPTRTPAPPPSPGRLVLVEGLSVSNANPQVNQSVNGRYRVRNDGGQPITARFLGVKGRHSSGASYDFFWVENLTLQPGQEYTYDANRAFDRAGSYSLTPNYYDGANWSDIKWSNGNTNYVTINVVSAPQPPTITPPPPLPTGNLAPRARREPDGINSGYAFDGNLSTFWTNGLGHQFNLRLTLPAPVTVNRIIVWDRPQNSPDNQQINQLIITLSNGMNKRFDMNSGGPRCIDVTLSSPQTINWVNLKADDASGNNGLSEVEIWAGSKTSVTNCSNKGSMP